MKKINLAATVCIVVAIASASCRSSTSTENTEKPSDSAEVMGHYGGHAVGDSTSSTDGTKQPGEGNVEVRKSDTASLRVNNGGASNEPKDRSGSGGL